MALPFFTIGHSNRSLADFIALLHENEVGLMADVRAFPRSRTNPSFNDDVLPASLAAEGIAYRHLAELGGRRRKSETVPVETNGYWTHQSFHNYADYALTHVFQVGLETLIGLGREQRCAVMCSEAVWWRCHRRIVTDYLLARGETVLHILGPGHVETAELTERARPHADGAVTYPPAGDLFA
ncbi:DUF488 domain-containing protein [Dyella sp. SG609]|uniref:DUF488 domain-containing protein n=1 Tax=Dyella sp. SG609 TaxID=2587018 RepID=UPI001445DACC|nr:DUF488 domain-containing protein [Dyella sp. SG609]NKJ22380.1 uncharacterized protein (DUF488 family) [Dyella sp. SG609]